MRRILRGSLAVTGDAFEEIANTEHAVPACGPLRSRSGGGVGCARCRMFRSPCGGDALVIPLQRFADGGVILIREPQAEARSEIMIARIRIIESETFRTVSDQSGGDTTRIPGVAFQQHRLAGLLPEVACQFHAVGHRIVGSPVRWLIDALPRGLCGIQGLAQILLGGTPIVRILAVTILNQVQRLAVQPHGIAVLLLRETHLRRARQGGGIMRRIHALRPCGGMNGERLVGIGAGVVGLALIQERQREIRA